MSKQVIALMITAVFMLAMGAVLVWAAPAELPDAVLVGEWAQQPGDDAMPPSNEYCLLCHSEPDRVWTLLSGETLSLTIDSHELAASVHGETNPRGPLACADCHPNHRFPHDPPTSATIREFQLERYATCRTCHQDQYTHTQDSVHGRALRSGVEEAAVCVDCHGGHDIQPPDEPRQRISLTCGNCHGAIFEEYRDSVHGAALLDESNPDVPTCVDCHGVHDISNPTSALFRVRSPELCAGCHADSELMAKYGISDQVFDTYLSDFHGTTVALFQQKDPNVATNKAVCYDCHGVHNIQRATSDNSQVVKDNLLTTCRQCHPDATAEFPNSWIGHRSPTRDSDPLLYMVNLFYKILIPTVLGGFLFLIATDIYHRIRYRGGRHQEKGA